ncbi:hypothetical protein [Chelativorans intermedius]|uniref:Uncharacterized protein n=1 Tax=Chelativorans intermedius TaxID=515947 RepID=A0ABV6DBC0_9HYPH|nr:hypothetical protein [Chelativorans intermedius]MCT9000290.1 hypothetical protein [Chelativorans intermedius]
MMMECMGMQGMSSWIMGAASLASILFLILIIVAIAALVKYLRA